MSTEVSAGRVPEWTRGDRMRKALDHAGLSVQDMADYLEVTRQAVGTWINGRRSPSKATMRLWALRCGVPLVWLETGKTPTLPSGPPSQYTTRDSNPEPIDMESRRLRRAVA